MELGFLLASLAVARTWVFSMVWIHRRSSCLRQPLSDHLGYELYSALLLYLVSALAAPLVIDVNVLMKRNLKALFFPLLLFCFDPPGLSFPFFVRAFYFMPRFVLYAFLFHATLGRITWAFWLGCANAFYFMRSPFHSVCSDTFCFMRR